MFIKYFGLAKVILFNVMKEKHVLEIAFPMNVAIMVVETVEDTLPNSNSWNYSKKFTTNPTKN